MQIIREEKNVRGLPLPNETRLVLSGVLPPHELITGCFVLAFRGNELLLTDLKDRGWDIPGGHVEPGETPVEAALRELYEETGASVDTPEMLGYELIRLHHKPERYKYPYPDSYMVFFSARIAKLDEFESTEETRGRAFFKPEEAADLSWIRQNRALYEEALRRAVSGK